MGKYDEMNLNLIKKYFIPKRILDIGANVGQFHQMCKGVFPESYIFSIEAHEACEPELKKVTSDYYIGLVTKENKEYEFYGTRACSTNTGNSIYKELTDIYSDEKVEIIKKQGIKLDDLFDGAFDLIKIDTQGSELDILEGGKELVQKATGILLEVSLTQYNENAPLYDEVVEYMYSIGFEIAEVLGELNHPIVQQKDILFIKK